jgi:hypothetical protein
VEEHLAGKGAVSRVQGRKLAYQLEDVRIAGEPIEQDTAGGRGVLGGGPVPGRHILTLRSCRRVQCGRLGALSAVVSAVTGVIGRNWVLHDFELEPEVRDWLDSLSDSDFKRADEVGGMLAEKGTGLGGPWSDHLEGAVWELRIRLHQVAVRVTYWCRPDGVIVLLTVFRKTRQHDQRQIDRAVRAQQVCERDHQGPAAHIYERQA